MDHYDTLGVSRDSDKEDIKSAYREKAKQHHPDKGGDPEKFRQLQVAYDTLSDDQTRAKYDNGELESDPVRIFLTDLFMKVLSETSEVETTDLFKSMISITNNHIAGLFQQKKSFERSLKKLLKIKTRIKKDSKKLFVFLTETQISYHQKQIHDIGTAIQVARESSHYLTSCEYEIDPVVSAALIAAQTNLTSNPK